MSYAIIRNANYKMGQLSYVYRHNERKNTNYSNKEIHKNSSIKNYSIKGINIYLRADISTPSSLKILAILISCNTVSPVW